MPGPGGHDVIVAPRVWEAVRRDLTDNQIASFRAALDALEQNPSDSNPRVMRISDVFAPPPTEYAIQWGDLIVVYEFVNTLVVEVLAVQRYPPFRNR